MSIFTKIKTAAAALGVAAALMAPAMAEAANVKLNAEEMRAQIQQRMKENEEAQKQRVAARKEAANKSQTELVKERMEQRRAKTAKSAPIVPLGFMAAAAAPVINYNALDYSQEVEVGGDAAAGTLYAPVMFYYWYSEIAAAGLSFEAKENKSYKITVNFQADAAADMAVQFGILKSGALAGIYGDPWGDVIRWSNWFGGEAAQAAVTGYFKASQDETVRILLMDWEQNELNYSVTIEETDGIISYTVANYSKAVLTDGTPVTGTLSNVVEDWCDNIPNAVYGAGLSFEAQKDKTYEIKIRFEADKETEINTRYNILTNEELTGERYEDVLQGCSWSYGDVKELTITDFFTAPANGVFRIFLTDWNYLGLKYTVTIKEAVITPYTELKYPANVVPTDGTPVTGTLTENVTDWCDNFVQGAALSFEAEENNAYLITVKFQSDVGIIEGVRYNILTSGDFDGNSNDNLQGYCEWPYEKEYVFADFFFANETGLYPILLSDFGFGDLSYTVTIKELPAILYTKLDYSTVIGINQPAAEGSWTNIIDYGYGPEHPAAGFSFEAEAGTEYRITLRFKEDQGQYIYGYFDILNKGELSDHNSDRIDGTGADGYGEFTLSYDFTSVESGTYRILAGNYYGTGGMTFTVHVATAHDCDDHIDYDAEKTVVKAPTCTQPGRKAHICSFCKMEHDAEDIDALGHNLVWAVTTPATCVSAAVETHACNRTNCTHTAGTRNGAAALGHAWNAGIQTTAPTCNAAGVRTFACTRTNCTGTRNEPIAQLTGAACGNGNSTLSQDRNIPKWPGSDKGDAVVALQSEFTVGPNPVEKSSGVVKFFWQGKRVQSASLSIFDASGNVVIRNVKISDKADTQARRDIGSWDLTDSKGRQVAEGAYLVRGTITIDGKKERVSVMVGVR